MTAKKAPAHNCAGASVPTGGIRAVALRDDLATIPLQWANGSHVAMHHFAA
jgi:hypothetical protein